MGINSIKTNLTKDSIISDIKLLLGADINKENVYVVVEGEDDIKGKNATIVRSYILTYKDQQHLICQGT